MRTEIVLAFLGILVFLTPFLGVPTAWKDLIQLVVGALIVLIAFVLRIQHRRAVRTRDQTLHIEHDPHGGVDVHRV